MLSSKILSEFGLQIKLAGEIEFYVTPQLSDTEENEFLAKILFNLASQSIPVWNIGKEVSPSQYEVALQPTTPETAIKQIEALKKIIQQTLNQLTGTKYQALFAAKPFDNLPGSGLHIHIGVNDKEGNSVLGRPGNFGKREQESEVMLNIIGGLCETMLKNFTKFAPSESSYKRFEAPKNKIEDSSINPLATYNNVPFNVSWGGNNRTTAIRIPVSTYDETTRHIEHRVAGADANPADVIEAILEGIYYGLKHKPTPPQKIHGNAFDAQYSFLKPFPKSLEEAMKLNP